MKCTNYYNWLHVSQDPFLALLAGSQLLVVNVPVHGGQGETEKSRNTQTGGGSLLSH